MDGELPGWPGTASTAAAVAPAMQYQQPVQQVHQQPDLNFEALLDFQATRDRQLNSLSIQLCFTSHTNLYRISRTMQMKISLYRDGLSMTLKHPVHSCWGTRLTRLFFNNALLIWLLRIPAISVSPSRWLSLPTMHRWLQKRHAQLETILYKLFLDINQLQSRRPTQAQVTRATALLAQTPVMQDIHVGARAKPSKENVVAEGVDEGSQAKVVAEAAGLVDRNHMGNLVAETSATMLELWHIIAVVWTYHNNNVLKPHLIVFYLLLLPLLDARLYTNSSRYSTVGI
jgi:hypothetical protein